MIHPWNVNDIFLTDRGGFFYTFNCITAATDYLIFFMESDDSDRFYQNMICVQDLNPIQQGGYKISFFFIPRKFQLVNV